jgi:hypothetical protein
MIRHTVVFKLKHPAGSQPELDFLRSARKLSAIPAVRNFECLRQTSKKIDYDFGLSMEFESPADYETYNTHPLHLEFVQTRWVPEVSDFMEIDYEPYTED